MQYDNNNTISFEIVFICFHIARCDHKTFTAAQLENITKTLTHMLDGYDIRLRPDFGGKCVSPTEF